MKIDHINGQRVACYYSPDTYDAYTAVYLDCPERAPGVFAARAMSEHPTHPLGLGQYTAAVVGDHLGTAITFAELPAECQAVVMRDTAHT